MSEFWTSCLRYFEQELSPQQFNTWIKPLRLEIKSDDAVSAENSHHTELLIIAPNNFISKWVKDRYLMHIEALGKTFFPNLGNVTIKLADYVNQHPAGQNTSKAVAKEPMPIVSIPATRSAQAYEKTRLISDLTFETLVVGKANDLARAAAMQVANALGDTYNPLFIYGGAGLGKTHLIHAIGNRILAESPEKIVRYVHAEDYYSDVVKAYQQKSFDAFKRYYRSRDVLLLDDVQFFNGKNRTQEEFFYAFNAFIEAKKQIIITCDTYPKDISGLEDRLITRFDWGLTVQIEPPEIEMRVAILKKKAEIQQIKLNDEVAFFIAKHLRSNVRELEGALKKVIAYSSFHNREITLESAKEALKDIIGAFNRQITVEYIQKLVADYYKLKVVDLYSKKRTRTIVRPRQAAMWLCKEVTNNSYPAIGEAFGGRDHTTVLHAVKTIESLRNKDNELNHDLHFLLQVLKG